MHVFILAWSWNHCRGKHCRLVLITARKISGVVTGDTHAGRAGVRYNSIRLLGWCCGSVGHLIPLSLGISLDRDVAGNFADLPNDHARSGGLGDQ